jgi:hypothetical protein
MTVDVAKVDYTALVGPAGLTTPKVTGGVLVGPGGLTVVKHTFTVIISPFQHVRRQASVRVRLGPKPEETSGAPAGHEPLNASEPVISGDLVVDETLSTSNGLWTNSPTDYNYQWLMDGVAVQNANFPTYTLVDADYDKTPTVEVTAANAYGPGTKATGRGGGKVKNRVSISGTPVLTGTESQSYAGFTIVGAGGVSPYTYSVSSGALPTGLSLDASTGAVSGTPSVPGAFAGIILRATDSAGRYANLATFTITIAAAPTGGVGGFNAAYIPVLIL